MQGGGYAEAVQPRHCDNGDVIQNQFFVLTGWESWAVASKRMMGRFVHNIMQQNV
jgi:hypothetical protein